MANTKRQWKPEESNLVRKLVATNKHTDNDIVEYAENFLPTRTFAAIVRHILTLKLCTPEAARVQRVLLAAAREKENKDPSTWISPKAAAKLSGLSLSSLYDAVYRGVLKNRKINGASLLKWSQVERYKRLHARKPVVKTMGRVVRIKVPNNFADTPIIPPAQQPRVAITDGGNNGHTDPAEVMLQLWKSKSIDSTTLVKLLEALS